MSSRLAELKAEFPTVCFICGRRDAGRPAEHFCDPDPVIAALVAALGETEKRAEYFASLDHAWAVGMEKENDFLRAQLTAEREAHVETQAQLSGISGQLAETDAEIIYMWRDSSALPSQAVYHKALAREEERKRVE